MASTASKGRKKTPAKTGRGGAKGGKQKTTRKPSAAELQAQSAITSEIILIGVLALTILLFLCNFGVIGVIGNQISRVMFGIFGTMAYALPVLAFIAIAFGISNQGNRIASMKLTAGIILFFLIGAEFFINYRVKRTKRPVSLEPMNPYERRIIHSALQNDRFVTTHSEGEEPYRRVVVTLKR